MFVEVDEVLKGKISSKTIKIYGDNGYLCRPYVTEFKVNESYILNLYTPVAEFDNAGKEKYAISICGVNWLQIHKNKVTGNIYTEKSIDKVELKKIKEIINGI